MEKPINKCQYNYPHCQKTAQFQHILKLGSVKINKGWICGNCKEYIETRNSKRMRVVRDQKNQPK